MDEQKLPSSANLRLRAAACDTVVSLPSLVLMWLYLSAVLDLSASEWAAFAAVVAAFGAFVAVVLGLSRRRMHAPIDRYLDSLGSKSDAQAVPGDLLREAFRTVVALPVRIQRHTLAVWVLASAILPLGMMLAGDEGWLTAGRGGALIVAGLTGGLVSSALVFFGYKRLLDPIRAALSVAVTDPDERRSLTQSVKLARKVQYAIVSTGFATVLFALALTYGKAELALDAMAEQWQGRALEQLASRIEGPDDVGLEAAVSRLFPDATLIPYAASFGVVDPAMPDSDELSTRVQSMTRGGEVAEGANSQSHRSHQLVWRTLEDGRLLYSAIPRGQLNGAFSGLGASIVVVLLVSLGVFVGIAYLLADDVGRTSRALLQSVERMAGGDLRRGIVVESEDELGELARGFERMGGALRATVGRVVEAADRVESAAAEINGVTQGVGMASADQVRQLQQANELMLEISQQVMGVADSAQALNVSVEESSSSILELGAAGDELNDTATVLSDKVDEVGGSIEQMVRSVKQVGSTSEELSDAAAETASSMEEMASAMRAVDNTAEQAARLSSGVVESAVGGQMKVSQTIDGMQAIRDATDRAEGVIRGLGASAKEIGAILDVIDDVADETNLLALNAAIIAAQAGEHGRAFSVVAEEIKELADRVLASTKEIGGLIRSVQEESTNAVGAIEEGSRSVASGVELSAEAGISLEEITRSSRESGTHIGEIVSSVREQTKAASHVVMLMDKVREGVERISSARVDQDRGNEVVFRSSVTMRDVAQQVRRTTEEQSRGFGRIRESVEGVREAVEQINASLGEQSSACVQVGDFLEQVLDSTRSNEESAQRMGGSMRDLIRQAESLREDVARFQI